MEYCHENHIPVDFVTRHHYTIAPPECIGHYAYSELMKAFGVIKEVAMPRKHA